MSMDKRLEKLEARGAGKAWEIPMYTQIYFKHLENYRRQEAGEPPIPLTPEEEHYEQETERDPAWRAYWANLDKRVEEYELDE